MNSRGGSRRLGSGLFGLLSLAPMAASAQSSSGTYHPANLGQAVLGTILFGLIGIGLAILGFKLFDLITPFNLEKEICENKNIAVGILGGAIVLGICWIVAAAMS